MGQNKALKRRETFPNTVGIRCLWLDAQRADTDCDWLKQLNVSRLF